MLHKYRKLLPPFGALALLLTACGGFDQEALGSGDFQLMWSDGTNIECSGARGASASGANDGSMCQKELEQCAGQSFAVRCSKATDGPDTSCDCLMDGEVVDSFVEPNYCLDRVRDLFGSCVFPR